MSGAIPLEHGLAVAAILFVLGLAGILARRDLIFLILSLDIMLNAAGFAFVVAGSRWNEPDGEIMFLLVLTLAAAEAAVAMGLLSQIHRRLRTTDVDELNRMRG